MTAWQQGELNKKLTARSTSLGSWHLPHVASVCSGLYTSLAFHECCDNTWILHRSYPPLFIQKHPFTNEFHTQLKKKGEGGCCLVQYNYVCILEVVEMKSDGWPYIHNYVSLLFLSSTFDLFKYTNIKQDNVAMNLFFLAPSHWTDIARTNFEVCFLGILPLLSTCRHMMSLHTFAYWKQSTAGGDKSLGTCYSSTSLKWLCDFQNSTWKSIVWGALYYSN